MQAPIEVSRRAVGEVFSLDILSHRMSEMDAASLRHDKPCDEATFSRQATSSLRIALAAPFDLSAKPEASPIAGPTAKVSFACPTRAQPVRVWPVFPFENAQYSRVSPLTNLPLAPRS